MKLKSKQTGEIMEFDAVLVAKDVKGNEVVHLEYDSIQNFTDQWEDYKEPKGYWYIRDGGNIDFSPKNYSITKRHKEIGNHFKTEEEAELAVEKLKAWKRLRDEGFKFKTWGWENEKSNEYTIWFELNDKEGDCSDLELLFGGEE